MHVDNYTSTAYLSLEILVELLPNKATMCVPVF